MKNRLDIAKELLTNDGLIFIQIDDDGMAYLKILADSIFPNGFVNSIAVKMSEPSGKKMAHTTTRLPKIKEYILLYKKNKIKLNLVKILKKEWDSEYNIFFNNFSKKDKKLIDEISNKNKRTIADIKLVDEILKKVDRKSVV